jgi:hypothetical protein
VAGEITKIDVGLSNTDQVSGIRYASPPPSRCARTIRAHREHHVAGLLASETPTNAPHPLHLHMTGDRSTEAPPSGLPGICAPLYSLVDADQASRHSPVMLIQRRM